MLRKVKVTCNLRKVGRNLYSILSYVRPAMVKAKKEKKYYEMIDKAMKVIRKYVKFIEPENEKGGGKCRIGL